MTPGPVCAATTAPTSSTSAARTRSPRRSRRRVAQRLGPVGGAEMLHRDVHIGVSGRLGGELDQAGQRAAGGAYLLLEHHLAAADVQDRLHRQRRAEQRRGGADPATATEELQRVDVEQRAASGPPRSSGRRAHGRRVAPASAASAAASATNPSAMPAVAESTTLHPAVELLGRLQRRLVRAGQPGRQVHRDDAVWRRARAGRGRRRSNSAGAGREVVTVTRRSPSARATSAGVTSIALAAVLAEDRHRQRHDPQARGAGHVGRQVRGGVGHHPHGSCRHRSRSGRAPGCARAAGASSRRQMPGRWQCRP